MNLFTIGKTFEFSASHQLTDLPADHPCTRLHGHNYKVTVILRSASVNAAGMLRDYNDLNAFRMLLLVEYDHRHLNDVVDFNPTAELLARHFYLTCKLKWRETCAVKVQEGDKTFAVYSETEME